jgi:hypothetical protein
VIEDEVRALVAEVMAAGGSRTLKQQVDDIAGLDHAVGMLQAALNARLAGFVAARRREDLAMGGSLGAAGRGAPIEIALARRISAAAVDHQLAFAEPLVADHPRLLEACLDGKVSQAAAKHVVKEAEILDPEQRQAIDGELTELAMRLTPGQTRKAAARRVSATDPNAAARKAQAARARKQVRAIMHGDATATISADLPAEQAVACWQALDHQARCLRGDGDTRSIRELMCDLFVERVTGQAKATDLRLEVGVVVATSSLLGCDDQPGKLVGHRGGDHGTLPAELVRELATSDSAWWRRLVCDPVDGTLLQMDPTRRRFTGALRRFLLYRDGASRRPYSDAPIYDIDHLQRHADGGPTSIGNGHGLAKRDHPLRDLPGWQVGAVDGDTNGPVRWTTPTGHSYDSRPPPLLGRGNSRRRIPPRRIPGRRVRDVEATPRSPACSSCGCCCGRSGRDRSQRDLRSPAEDDAASGASAHRWSRADPGARGRVRSA